MAQPFPPHLMAEFDRIMGPSFDDAGNLRLPVPIGTKDEVKGARARIGFMKKELRLLRKAAGLEMRQVRSVHVSDHKSVKAGRVASFFGGRAASSDRAKKREHSKADEAIALGPYQSFLDLIDRTVLQLDGVLLQLDARR